MKVALIAPPYPLEEAPSPPLGICYVAAACEAAGAEVRIFDYIVGSYSQEKLCRQLDEFQPDIVGSTAVTLSFPAGSDIIKAAKRHNPSLITVMGGPHVSFSTEKTLRDVPEIDLIVMGEAEHTLMKWLPVAKNRADWHGIKGLAFIENNEFITTGHGKFIQDLDSLPLPSRHLLPLSKYKALGFPISIITSRGCPNKCIFCLGRRMVGFKVRYRDPVLVADEIESILDLGFERINIADDLFTANSKRVKIFCEEILKRQLVFGWSAFARVDTVDEETLMMMKNAGCDAVSFGIESGNQEMLKRVRKRITLDQARNAVSLCKKAGMIAHASFMVGLPGETEATLKDTLNFARDLKIEHGYHFLAPFPGTKVREKLAEYDLQILTDDWTQYDANKAIVRTSQLGPEEMEAFVAEAYRPIMEEWEKAKQRYEEGACTDKERLAVESEQRLKLIYHILSNDIIETVGRFGSNGHNPVEELSRRIAETIEMKVSFIQSYVRLWMVKDYLTYTDENEQINWRWKASPELL